MDSIDWTNLNLDKDEAAKRGTEIKLLLGIKDNGAISSEQLKFLKDNYQKFNEYDNKQPKLLKDNNHNFYEYDNKIQVFLNSITDFEHAALWLSRYSYSLNAALTLLGFIKYKGKRGL